MKLRFLKKTVITEKLSDGNSNILISRNPYKENGSGCSLFIFLKIIKFIIFYISTKNGGKINERKH